MLLARRRGRAGAIPSRPSASYDRLFSFEVFSQAASLSLNLGYLVHDASCLCLLHSGAFVAVRNLITIGDSGGSVVQDATCAMPAALSSVAIAVRMLRVALTLK